MHPGKAKKSQAGLTLAQVVADGPVRVVYGGESGFQQGMPTVWGQFKVLLKYLAHEIGLWGMGVVGAYRCLSRKVHILADLVNKKISSEKMSAGLHGQVQSIAVIYGSIKLFFHNVFCIFLL